MMNSIVKIRKVRAWGSKKWKSLETISVKTEKEKGKEKGVELEKKIEKELEKEIEEEKKGRRRKKEK